MRRALFGLLVVLAGCNAEPRLLAIDVRTDFVPGEEFTTVRVEVTPEGGASFEERVADLDGRFEDGVRVLEREVEASSALVAVELLDASGAVVVARPVLVNLDTDQVATVVLSRRCADVSCDAETEACDLGRCVSLLCSEETPEECESPECTAASDCTADAPACVIADCTASGGCFYGPDDSACDDGERCHPTRGCEPTEPGPCAEITATDPRAVGGGTEADPYLLCNATQLLDWLGAPGTDVVRLGQDIDVSGMTITPAPLTGATLDGGGYAIRGVTVMGGDRLGLFTNLGAGTTVRQLVLDALSVEGGSNVGGLAGSASNATIENVTIRGVVTGTGDRVGGLVGSTNATTIRDVHGEVEVTGEVYVGGLLGYQTGGTTERSSTSGTVTGSPNEGCTIAGGLIGQVTRGGVSQSFSSAIVSSGGASIGGLAGWTQESTIEDCYATGQVTAGRSIADFCSTVNDLALAGGLIGVDFNGTVTRSYATGATFASHLTAAGLIAHGWTTSDMQHNFATGAVNAANERGGLYGRANGGTDTGSYWSIAGTGVDRMCSGGPMAACNDSRGIDTPEADTYFFSSANPPLDQWDFDTVWQEHPDRLPTLRWQSAN